MAEQLKNTSDYLIRGLSFIFVVLPVSWIFSIFYIILSPISVFITKLEPVVDELYHGMECSRYITERHREPVKRLFRFIREKTNKFILEKYVEKYLKEKDDEIMIKGHKDKEGETVDKQKTDIMKMIEQKKHNFVKRKENILQVLKDQKLKIVRPFLLHLQDLQNELMEMKVEVKKYLKEREDEVMNKDHKNKEGENVDKKITNIMEKIKLKEGNIMETKDKVLQELKDQKLKIIRPFLLDLQDLQDELKEIKVGVKKYLKLRDDEVLAKDHEEKERETINKDDVGEIDLKEKEDRIDDKLTEVKVDIMDKYLKEKDGGIVNNDEAVKKDKKGTKTTLLSK